MPHFVFNQGDLWISDGTTGGTGLLTKLRETGNPGVTRLTAVGDDIFFIANDGEHGFELWHTDGTPAGTEMVKDINGDPASSSLSTLVTAGETLYFLANDGQHGVELWKSDGTEDGTVLVKDILPGTGNGPSSDDSGQILGGRLVRTNAPVPVGDTLYFSASDTQNIVSTLWKSGGTGDSTVPVVPVGPVSPRSISNLTAFGDRVLFSATGNSNPAAVGESLGAELWISDGTANGTKVVKDIRTEATGSSPHQFIAVGEFIYFLADDGGGKRVWRTDGTEAGTEVVSDALDVNNNQIRAANGSPLVALGNKLFFNANDGEHGIENWIVDVTDPENPVTSMVSDINPGAGHGSGAYLTPFNGFMYFSADNGTIGTELWKSDGTGAGTTLVKDIFGVSGGVNRSAFPTEITLIEDTLVFGVGNNSELWKSDGTTDGTVQIVSGLNFQARTFAEVQDFHETGVGHQFADFNGDGRMDVLFAQQGAVFASNYEWQMNDRSIAAQGPIDLYDKDFSVQVIGDYDGDGRSDVVFQNPDTGGVWMWLLDGTAIKSQGAVDVGDPAYHILGNADLNGDGRDDLVFRNDAGFVYLWQMDGRTNTPLPVQALDPSWHLVGAGDFNGGGRADLLLRNISNTADNGAFFLWQMNGNIITGQGGIERPSTDWKTFAVGDFDGDDKTDFAVRNQSAGGDNGAVWVYLMNGTSIKSQGAAGIADPAVWHVQEVGDLNGDGNDDILMRNDAGYFYSWNLNGTSIASEGLAGTEAGNFADPAFSVVMQHWDLV